MKSLVIWGVPRSGKTTLANRVRREFGHGVVQLDAMKRVYDALRPEDGIYASAMTNRAEARLMAAMLVPLIQCLSWRNALGEYHAFEGVGFDPDHVLPALAAGERAIPPESLIVLCLGYAEIEPEAKVREIERYETAADWSARYDVEEKLRLVQAYREESVAARETAARLGLRYFDVSFDREGVLEEAMTYIRDRM